MVSGPNTGNGFPKSDHAPHPVPKRGRVGLLNSFHVDGFITPNWVHNHGTEDPGRIILGISCELAALASWRKNTTPRGGSVMFNENARP